MSSSQLTGNRTPKAQRSPAKQSEVEDRVAKHESTSNDNQSYTRSRTQAPASSSKLDDGTEDSPKKDSEYKAVKDFKKLRENRTSLKDKKKKRSFRSPNPYMSSSPSNDGEPSRREALRKKIVDISKTKKRKEFDFDNQVLNRFSMLV